MITPRRCLPVLLLSVAGAVSTVHAQGGDPFYGAIVEPRAARPRRVRAACRSASSARRSGPAAGQPVKASMRSARHVQVRVDPLPAREGAQGKTRHYVVTLSYL